MYANCLKQCLEEVISETQSGFMKNLSISSNIYTLDVLDYSDFVSNDALILLLDLLKAFDTVEHNYIFKASDNFGFGNHFICVIKTLYDDVNICFSFQCHFSKILC